MPRYEYDPSKSQATIEIFPKDEYEFIVGEPKAFIRKNRKNQDSFGVRVSLTHTEGAYKGKRTVFTCYLHSEGAQSMSKRFQMAVFGYEAKAEAEQDFNKATSGLDWSFDPETGSVGAAWKQLGGARVIGNLDVGKNEETDEPQQVFKSWRPAVAVSA